METGVRIDVARLRRDIIEATKEGSGLTRRGLSLKATDGKNPDAVRDIFRVSSRVPSFELVAGLAGAMGKPVADYIMGMSIETGQQWLTVTGSAAAGVWKEQTEWHPDDWFQIEVSPAPIYGKRSGLVVDGRSMDRVFPPGTILDCVDLMEADVTVQDGDYVIAERRNGSLREVTVKRAQQTITGKWELVAESTLPEFDTPIPIGSPDPRADDDEEIRVKAIVIWAHRQLYRPLRQVNRF